MFSHVDANQLVCFQMTDGLYVVDIRKPKRLVFSDTFHYSSPTLYIFCIPTLLLFVVQEILKSGFFSFISVYVFSFLQHLATDETHGHVQWSYDGRRLLCSPMQSIEVYDLFPNKKLDRTDRVSFAQSPTTILSRFARKEYEFVVSSKDRSLFVWQLPSVGQGHWTVESPLLELAGHQSDVSNCSFNKSFGFLASCDKSGVVKLWVPNEGN